MTGRALVDYDDLLHVLGKEAELLASSLEESRLDAIVPGCPGLTAGETARHVGSLHRMLWLWLRKGRRPAEWQHDPAPGQSLPDFVRSGVAPLLAELSAHRPEESCSTWWTAESNYGFWRRRMAHEATIHRIDVQGALRPEPDPVAEDIALDGIDEVLSLWFEHRLMVLGVHGTRDGTVAIRSGGREWLARATSESTSVIRRWDEGRDEGRDEGADEEPGGGVVTVSAEPDRMYRWLWGRLAIRDVAWEGENSDAQMDAVAQLWALLRIATR